MFAKLPRKLTALLLVLAQFISLYFIVVTGDMYPNHAIPLTFVSIGFFIGMFAVLQLPPGTLNIFPTPRTRCTMTTSYMYSFVRHPMYFALLLFCIGYCIEEITLFRAVSCAGLLLTLDIKRRYEEQLLIERFPDYLNYMAKTKAIIPYIY